MKESSNECNHYSGRRCTCRLETSVSGESRHGVAHYRRVRHLHDICGGLSVLHREKLVGTNPARSPGNTDLLHNLSALQQSDDPPRGQAARTWRAGIISRLLAAHPRTRCPLPLRHRAGMAPLSLRTWTDYLDESFWNNVLLPGWPACLSRYGWTHPAHRRAAIRAGGSRWTR